MDDKKRAVEEYRRRRAKRLAARGYKPDKRFPAALLKMQGIKPQKGMTRAQAWKALKKTGFNILDFYRQYVAIKKSEPTPEDAAKFLRKEMDRKSTDPPAEVPTIRPATREDAAEQYSLFSERD